MFSELQAVETVADVDVEVDEVDEETEIVADYGVDGDEAAAAGDVAAVDVVVGN